MIGDHAYGIGDHTRVVPDPAVEIPAIQIGVIEASKVLTQSRGRKLDS